MRYIITTLTLGQAAASLLSGCALFQSAVPTTKISGTIAGQTFSISNPKDTAFTNLVVTVSSNGTATLAIGALTSVNNSNTVTAGYAGQAELVTAVGTQMTSAFTNGEAAAIKAAAASAK